MGRGAMPHCRDALGGDSGVDPRPKHATVGEAVEEDAAINATAPQWPVRRLHIGDAEVATRSSPWRSRPAEVGSGACCIGASSSAERSRAATREMGTGSKVAKLGFSSKARGGKGDAAHMERRETAGAAKKTTACGGLRSSGDRTQCRYPGTRARVAGWRWALGQSACRGAL
jgi:hypothetical protein